MITPQPDSAVFAQVAAMIRDDILSGRLAAGQRIPSETDLQQQFGIARGTARQAIRVLRTEGLVQHIRGHGVYVRELPEVSDLHIQPGSTVTTRMPTAAERVELDLDEGVPVWVVVTSEGDAQVFAGDRWRLRWPGP